MVSQQTKTFVVVVVALSLGYWYNSQDPTNQTSISYYSGKVAQVPLNQLDNIRWSPPIKMDKRLSAFVLGATGAVGKELVNVLAADPRFEKVTLIGRRPVALSPDANPGHKKVDNQIVDFEKIDEYKEVFQGYDIGFSTLGTTRKKSGADGFYRVDHDYVVQTAKLAKDGGCKHLHLVSSAGANKNAYFLYPKTKGQVEEELTEMDFPKLSIYRPAVLLVDGGREESRMGEAILQGLLKPLDRKRWFSVDVPMLAKVMVANCFRETTSKFELLDNAALNKFARDMENGNVPPPPAPASEAKKDQDEQPF